MASTIQVDTIKDIGGNTMISSNGSGTFTNSLPAPTSGIAASAIDSGTIATARLGSGTASSSTFLRGDQTYAEAGGGKILQTINVAITSEYSTTSNSFSDVTGFSLNITPSAASSKIYVGVYAQMYNNDTDTQSGASTKFLRNINGGGYTNLSAQSAGISAIVSTVDASAGSNNAHLIPFNVTLIDSPSATTVCNYKIMGAASWGGTARYCYDSISGYMWAMEIGA